MKVFIDSCGSNESNYCELSKLGENTLFIELHCDSDTNAMLALEKHIMDFAHQGGKNLIIDFQYAKRCYGSMGMGLLVKIADVFRDEGEDQIGILNIPEKIVALFQMLGLLSLFSLYDNVKDALADFKEKKSQK